MNLLPIIDEVSESLSKGYITPKILTSRLPYISSNLEFRSFHSDPLYYPPYFYLGRHLNVKSVLSLSIGTGITLSCFLMDSKNTDLVLGFQKLNKSDFYSIRMPKHNIQKVFKGNLSLFCDFVFNKEFQKQTENTKWQAILVDEDLNYDDCLSYLRFAWNCLDYDGVVIIDRVLANNFVKRAFDDFCTSINKDSITLNTKYGIGLIQK